MDLSFLPALNASLNAAATVLLLVGRSLARRGRIEAHRRVMGAAFAVSAPVGATVMSSSSMRAP